MDKPRITPQPAGTPDPSAARMGETEVVFASGPAVTPFYRRENLESGALVEGPALVVQTDTTIVVPPGWGGPVDQYGNLVLTLT